MHLIIITFFYINIACTIFLLIQALSLIKQIHHLQKVQAEKIVCLERLLREERKAKKGDIVEVEIKEKAKKGETIEVGRW
jgi:predicted GNAT family N-acyltransferase